MLSFICGLHRSVLNPLLSRQSLTYTSLRCCSVCSVQFAQLGSASASRPALSEATDELIDKASFFEKSSRSIDDPSSAAVVVSTSNWSPKSLRPVPAFYPLEKSSRLIDDSLSEVATRLSDCLRVLSVHASYDDEAATANLVTAENVEMHLSLWATSRDNKIVVELQRRNGCSITFHRYSRYILDAAIGDFDVEDFGVKGSDIDSAYSKKVERLLSRHVTTESQSEEENAVIALEIAHGLLMKDRMDARQLGLESLCLLTDPRKTGTVTALIAARVILLGTTIDEENNTLVFDESPFEEIRQTILSLVQFRRIGEEVDYLDEDDLSDKDRINDSEHLGLLHNLALAVLANALDVMENLDSFGNEPEETTKPSARARTTSSDMANTFMNDAQNVTQKDILSTLISELGKATMKPHNACLSAKCLRSLLGASKDARLRAKELGAKAVVSTALDVGVRTHAKLETECKKVEKVLSRQTETVNENVEQEEDEEEELGER